MNSPLEELERLKAEWQEAVQRGNDAEACGRWAHLRDTTMRHADYLLSAAREAETLREDAERWRKARELAYRRGIENPSHHRHEIVLWCPTSVETVDAAIDAARKGAE